MKKRIVSILVLSSIFLGSLAGCGSSTESDATSDETSTATSEVSDTGFPDETINWIVPGKAGGGSDLAIRYMADSMTRNLGLTTSVTNYDSSTVAHQMTVNAENDGSNIMLANVGLNIQYLMGSADINPKTDLSLIACVEDNGYTAICVPIDAPYDTFDEFIAYAKEHPGELKVGQPNGGNNTFQFGMIEEKTGIDLTPVECSSESDRLTSLAGGFIDVGMVGVQNAIEYEKAGKLKTIATLAADGKTIDEYQEGLSDNYKTCQEQGYDDVYWQVYCYIYGPAGMDTEQIEKMNASFETIMEDEECKDGILKIGQIPEWHNLEESTEIRDQEIETLTGVAKDLGLYGLE